MVNVNNKKSTDLFLKLLKNFVNLFFVTAKVDNKNYFTSNNAIPSFQVVSGKGQFSCSNKRCCEEEGLRSWEVNFSYVEAGERKQALVKSRLCADCSYMLNYHHKFVETHSQDPFNFCWR